MNRAATLAAFLTLLSFCGCASQQTVPLNSATSAPVDPVAQAAALLAEADHPDAGAPARAAHIAALDRLGLRRADDSADDPVARWRAEVQANGHIAAPFRGRVLGPAYRSGWIEPGANATVNQLFLAGEIARISLTNTHREPMALTISDPQSKIICQQDGPPPGRCEWVALFTQRYRIELRNSGKTRLRYFLVTN